jgi:xylan 1,4-beta-xylosidase
VLLAVGTALVLGGAPAASAQYANPVIPGNVADPSVVQADGAYWAAATSGSYAPVFPIFRSTDLVSWQQVGAVFDRPPRWTRGNYWAPGLAVRDGVWSVYYSASRARGRPCVSVAQATRPTGPWRDRGLVVCPPSGAIDAAPVSDVNGNRYLLWKRMGVGHGIYGAALSDDGRTLVSGAVELIKPGQAWEQGVTEGPDLVADPAGGYLLVFAGGHCCRPPCSYAVGVARADAVLGPYTKDPDNPVLRDGNGWKCAGHGTLVRDPSGGLAFLHHAYRADDPFDVHRQALLDPVRFGADGGAVFGDAGVPVAAGPAADALSLRDDFAGRALRPGWQWAWDARPRHTVGGGVLRVGRGLVSRAWVPRDYVAEARVRGRGTFGVLLTDGRLVAVRAAAGGLERLDGGRVTARAAGAARELRIDVRGGRALAAYARASGGPWRAVGPPLVVPEGTAIDRVALGPGTFEAVTLRPYRSAR